MTLPTIAPVFELWPPEADAEGGIAEVIVVEMGVVIVLGALVPDPVSLFVITVIGDSDPGNVDDKKIYQLQFVGQQ